MTQAPVLALGTCALGRVIDARGKPLDGGVALRGPLVRIDPGVPAPGERSPIEVPFWTGVRCIDGLLTIGRGARVGIFGAPGCGKSTLIENIVERCDADAIVVALIGERGREAREWIARCDARTTLVCATSDRDAQERIRATHVALSHADALRRRGLHVLLVIDSLARVANALREHAVSRGESTGRGGYPPSVFSALARMVEAAGAIARGSVTAIVTVLDDGDERDPVSDAARSLLDGHIALSAHVAGAGRFPAIDVVASTSRTMPAVANVVHGSDAACVRAALMELERTADARALGIEPSGHRARVAVAHEDAIEAFLRQPNEPVAPAETLAALRRLADTLEESHGHQ